MVQTPSCPSGCSGRFHFCDEPLGVGNCLLSLPRDAYNSSLLSLATQLEGGHRTFDGWSESVIEYIRANQPSLELITRGLTGLYRFHPSGSGAGARGSSCALRGLSLARLDNPYVSGWYEKSGGQLYVNRAASELP